MTQPKELSLQDFPHSEKQAPGMRLLQADFTNTTVLTLPDIDYVCRDGRPLHLHIMMPQQQSPDSDIVDGPYPLIVYVQGSAWFKQNTAMNLAQLGRMARRGFVIASVEYRPSDLALSRRRLKTRKPPSAICVSRPDSTRSIRVRWFSGAIPPAGIPW